MAAVADLERFLERLFERTSARVFRARLQAVQVERRLERAMEAARNGRGAATIVPSRYRVRLHPADLDDLAARSNGAAALAGRLADSALGFARQHGYHLAVRPTVILVADPAVERGRIEVDALTDRPGTAAGAPIVVPEPRPAEPAPDSDSRAVLASVEPTGRGPAYTSEGAERPTTTAPPSPVMRSSAPAAAASQSQAEPPAAWGLVDVRPAPAAVPAAHGVRGEAGATAVFRRPAPPAASARLRMLGDGREQTLEVGAAPLTIGRAPDNGLVLPDARVSRRHGRLQARRGTLVYTDLGSTNGSRVNGIRVDEFVLGLGDRLQLGDVVLVVESLPG